MIPQETNTQDFEAQGYRKAKAVALFGPGVILSTELVADIPWREDPEARTNIYIDLNTIVKILSSIGMKPELGKNDTLDHWPITHQRLESSRPSELFVKIDQGVLHLVTIYRDGETYFSMHSGNWDVHFSEQEVAARPDNANSPGVLQ